jgi:hypothetical protein
MLAFLGPGCYLPHHYLDAALVRPFLGDGEQGEAAPIQTARRPQKLVSFFRRGSDVRSKFFHSGEWQAKHGDTGKTCSGSGHFLTNV